VWIHSKKQAGSVDFFDKIKFLPILKDAEEQLQQKGFLSFWSSRRYEHAKMLIFLFLVYSFLLCRKQRSSCSRRGSSPSGRAGGTSTHAHLPLLRLFLSVVQEAEEQLQQKGFLSFWSSRRYEHAKMLIFLFQVSHILVCCQVRQSQEIQLTGRFG
jgi:hypothetical protein